MQIFSQKAKKNLPQIVEVEQNPVHIGDTIHQWLTFGNPQASFGLIQCATETAILKEVIHCQKNKIALKSGLTLNGLSRGQKQRIAIARAIIAEPDYIIFDEPTSALDEKTAVTIMNSIIKLGIGVLVITHDRQFIHLFDDVYEFENKTFKRKVA